ncbi:MAG: polysaccharide biosynthesis tyrosine autokinase [Geobacteraceae bacterium]|nr:polysaccharide biosynthesis tyrosine autokinase [Geobacteraceae bacterium]
MIPNLPSPSAPTPLQPAEVHLHDYLRVILRRRWTFLVAFCAVFFGVAVYTFSLKPIYEASATLHVRDEKGGNGDLLGALGVSRQNPIDAEIEILKSRSNAEQVVKRLQLDRQVTRRSRGLSFKIADFASAAPQGEYHVELTGPDSYKVLAPDDRPVGTGKSGVLLQSGELRLLLTDLKGKPGDSFHLSLAPLQAAANGLKGRIKAAEVGNKTRIIRLSFSDNNPVMAREVVNTLAQVYLEQSVAFKTQEARKSSEFIEEQMNSVRGDLDAAEKNLQAYKTGAGVVMLDSEAEELVKKISDTEKERTGLALQRKQVEFSLAALRDAQKQGKVYTPAGLKDDPGVGAMAGKLADLEVQKRALLSETTDAHPQVKALQGQIDEIQRKLIAIYDTSQKNLARQEGAVAQTLARYEGLFKQLPAAERDLARLMRHTKVNADIYTFLLQKHEEARIAKASTISNINVIDPAITPGAPIKPNKKKNLLLGFLVGAMLGVGLAFFQEYLDDTIKDAEEAKRAIGLPLLAVIPFIPRREAEAEAKCSVSLITQLEPKSSVAEAFRSLRTSLHFSAINREKKILLLTSTFPGEGKSTISANLANTLSQTGARVLIIDCDLRRSSLHEKFGHSKIPGLAELLTGDSTFTAARHNSGISGLDLISAGTTPPNPAELLGSEAMRRFLETHRESYDHIIIDAPPVLAVTDAPVLTAMSDMVLVVMEAGRVPLKAAQRMREMLATIQAPVAGLVVNDKTGRGESYGYYGGRYYRYGYGYGYGYYGEDDSAAKAKKPWWRRLF